MAATMSKAISDAAAGGPPRGGRGQQHVRHPPGLRDNTPDSYLDDVVRDQWLQRAVEEGCRWPCTTWPIATSSTTNWISRRENLDKVLRLLHGARQEPRADALARLRIGVLRDHGTEQEQQEGVRAHLRPLVDEDHDWRAARASAEIALAYAHGRGARKNRFAAIEWAQHASRLQPDDEGIDEIQSQVLNSHSLVKTIGTVFGAYMGRGGISAEDLPPAGRGRHGAPAGPDGSCRPGCCWATRRWPAGLALGTAPLWLCGAAGALGVAAGRPALARRGLGDAAPALRHAHPARKTACSRSRTRRRCSARSNGARPGGRAGWTRST